jgi:hypothetical protein
MSSPESSNDGFNEDLVKRYPKSNRRLSLSVGKYGISKPDNEGQNQCLHISPYGVQFRTAENFTEGELLKIHVGIPNYWQRKQKFVEYTRVDEPDDFKILAKVVSSTDVGKRGKKKMVLVRTVNMDEVDEQVLKSFLKE